MALNFEFGKVTKVQTINGIEVNVIDHPHDDARFNPVLESLLTVMMVVGIGEVSDKTYEKLCTRIRQYQAVFGPLLQTDKVKMPLLDADIAAYKGLHTNVSFMPDTKWYAHLADMALRHFYVSDHTISALPLIELCSIRRDDGTYYAAD